MNNTIFMKNIMKVKSIFSRKYLYLYFHKLITSIYWQLFPEIGLRNIINKKKSHSRIQSVIFFTTWKCGSVVTDLIFKEIAKSSKSEYLDYQTYFEYNFSKPLQRLKKKIS